MTDPTTADPAPRSTRCWTLSGNGGQLDVEVTAVPDDRLADLLPQMSRALGVPVPSLWSGSSRLPGDMPLTDGRLRHGAVLGIAGPVRGGDRMPRSSALELHVVGGPDAGRTAPLGQGRHVLGRGGEASVRFDDPDVSRRHVAVQVGGGAITVADLDSTNGSRLDGLELDHNPREWPVGAVVRLGASAVTIAGPAGPVAAVEPMGDGRIQLRPIAPLRAGARDVDVTFPRPPTAPPRRRLAWVAVALPAVGGVLMAWLLHTPTFLFFAVLSPVVALATWLSERWSGRRTGRRDAAAHAVAVLAAETRLAEAVHADVRASDTAHPDPATVTTAARRRTRLLWSRAGTDADALTVRVGTGPGPTQVTRIHGDGVRTTVTAPHVPILVDVGSCGGLAVVGPRDRALAAVTNVLVQLSALHPPGDVDLVLLTEAERIPEWSWARWLPHLDPGSVHVAPSGDLSGPARRRSDDALHAWVTTTAARRRTAGSRRAGRPDTGMVQGRLVVVVDRSLDQRTSAALHAARDVGVVTVAAAERSESLPVAVDAILQLGGETGDVAVLRQQGAPDRTDVVVDRLPRAVAAGFARDLAALRPATAGGSIPRHVRLLDLPSEGLRPGDGDRPVGEWLRARDQLVAVVGKTAQGPVRIDLCRDGPHALVAGTTGSGKSELLQTLIASLALHHPPERCSFLLVDYKGGAAFAEAASLPHTVGLVTDLDGRTTERALRSLGAELTRREGILSAHEAADIAALPETVELARLVIVVDEFATLAEELPSFVPSLIGIAQRGRSLGVHLVLATQRPGGVVSPEIRANCSLRICLRTTDEGDSRDVLGAPDAAFLPVDLPGRALLRAGSGSPAALQVARVSAAAAPPGSTTPEVRPRNWPAPSLGPARQPLEDGQTDLARLCSALSAHARALGCPRPHRPWRRPLPDHVEIEDLPGGTGAAERCEGLRLPLGLVDRPDAQTQDVLQLDLAEGGGWLVVGGPRSGRTTLLRTVLGEAVRRLGPGELHVHVLESHGGSLVEEAGALPHTGTVVGGEDALRIVRLLDRLNAEVTARRAGSGTGPRILLLIDGVEAVTTLMDETDPGRGSAALLRLVRDGAAVGLTCVLTADRVVPGGRLAAIARQRIVLPLADRADYAVAGIPPRAVPAGRPPGRALVGEDAVECQLALPRPLAPTPVTSPTGPPPLRIVELPPDPRLSPLPRQRGDAAGSGRGAVILPIGPGGDDGRPLEIDLLRTGGLLVTGPPGSGRTSALEAFGRHLAALGVPVLHLGHAVGPPMARGEDAGRERRAPSDMAGVSAWVAGLAGRPGVVLADDVGVPAEWPALSGLPTPGAASGIALIAAGSPGTMSGHYQGPVAALRRGRSGLLLCPGTGDGEVLGIRLPRTPLPVRPGSGWLVTGTRTERVQVARSAPFPVRTPAPAQSRSIAGPISCVAYQASS
ncbi:MAG TPA: FtsK/SpoIIIE domain-containing protein [Blastococcus sp.]|nr:FtsK/SpoIIIE domain-containing protein [Blastococcus sp.]